MNIDKDILLIDKPKGITSFDRNLIPVLLEINLAASPEVNLPAFLASRCSTETNLLDNPKHRAIKGLDILAVVF